MMRVYFFHQAPRVLQEMSQHGGDEDFVILIPDVGTAIKVWDPHRKRNKTHSVDDDDCWFAQLNVVDAIADGGDIQNAGVWDDPDSGITYQVFITAHA